MRTVLVLVLSVVFVAPAHAFLGAGDIVYDPQATAKMSQMFEQAQKMYDNAKKQLDSMVAMERTISEAQQAYESLSNGELKQVASGLRPDGTNVKTAAGLRAEIARLEGQVGVNKDYLRYQKTRLKQLENIELLQKATAENVTDSTGKMNQATAEKITAQSTATLAALASAEEQRKVQEEMAQVAAANAHNQNMKDSKKVYESMGK